MMKRINTAMIAACGVTMLLLFAAEGVAQDSTVAIYDIRDLVGLSDGSDPVSKEAMKAVQNALHSSLRRKGPCPLSSSTDSGVSRSSVMFTVPSPGRSTVFADGVCASLARLKPKEYQSAPH